MIDDFNERKYQNNVYYEYVYKKNKELDLGLTSSSEILNVANIYYNKVHSIGLCEDQNDLYIEKEEKGNRLLLSAVDEFFKKIRKFRTVNYGSVKENAKTTTSIENNAVETNPMGRDRGIDRDIISFNNVDSSKRNAA